MGAVDETRHKKLREMLAEDAAKQEQYATKLCTVGLLGTSTPVAWTQWVAAFRERLRELGWTEGRTVAMVLSA